MDVESTLAKHTAHRAIFVGPPLVLIFGLTRGLDGAVGALIGLAIVVGYILLSGAMLSVAARISLGAYHAAALFGFFLRLGLIAVTMLAISRLWDVDRISMGITAVVSYLVLYAWEAVAVAKGGERELQWIK
jgi:hypothetical protein